MLQSKITIVKSTSFIILFLMAEEAYNPDRFKSELSVFLEKIGVTNAEWSPVQGSSYSGPGNSLLIPKVNETGFDISFCALGIGVYPKVAEMELVPLDTMEGYEIPWCRRFLLSALSKESQLSVFHKNGKVIRRSFHYFDPWFEKYETYSEPKFLYRFWISTVEKIFQNDQVNIAHPAILKIIDELDMFKELRKSK